MPLINFVHPWLLFFLPPVLLLLYFLSRQRLILFIFRSLTVISLFGILSGVEIKAAGSHLCRIYLLDNSGSIFLNQTEVLEAIGKNVQLLTPLDRAGLVVFGQDASVEVMPVNQREFRLSDALISRCDQRGTDLARAIRFTFNLFPAGYQKELVILTDGNHTREKMPLIQSELTREGITVFTAPIGPQSLSDIRVVSFQLPESVGPAEPVQARLTLTATVDTKVNLHFYIDGKLWKEIREVALPFEQDTYLTLNLPAPVNAVQEYEISLKTDLFQEICLANNYARAIVQQAGPAAILYLSDTPGQNNLEKIITNLISNEKETPVPSRPADGGAGLNQAPWQMTSRPAGSDSLRNLSLYHLLILDNVRADIFSLEALVRIKNFVAEGGGLLISGGPNSFGLGKYSDTPLEEIAPVRATPEHNIALILVLDKSGSMADPVSRHQTKFQIMQAAIQQITSLLKESDKLEVSIFGEDV
ncbi:MAG: VWA domain-containing protein, partial [Planctomycetota bacterium]